MATTSKELIEILQKYTKPDDVVIWQYYTTADFEYDEESTVTNEEFAEIADSKALRYLWDDIPDQITEAIYDYKNKEGQE
jgi:hypothetical protein